MINNDLQKKIDFALKLLSAIPNDEPIELSYSGGKDSDVILELAKMAGINFRAIYKNTSIDPPGTESHCKSKGVEIITPKTSFFDIVKNKGCPTRRARFCCSELKEYKVLDRAIHGVRRSESHNRRKRYKEPEICRDAYWKITGDWWKPDWENDTQEKWIIFTTSNCVECAAAYAENYILAFLTEEMRDAFYENFKDLIEQCKELL